MSHIENERSKRGRDAPAQNLPIEIDKIKTSLARGIGWCKRHSGDNGMVQRRAVLCTNDSEFTT